MDKATLFAQISEEAQQDQVQLHGALMTRVVVLAEFHTPDGELAFHRWSTTSDGRSLVTWEVDGLLWTALTQGRSKLGPMGGDDLGPVARLIDNALAGLEARLEQKIEDLRRRLG